MDNIDLEFIDIIPLIWIIECSRKHEKLISNFLKWIPKYHLLNTQRTKILRITLINTISF